jgi:PAS domain S-box-containing protein
MSESAFIIDLVHDSIVGRDAAGRITLWNAAAESLYGWNRAEAVGRGAAELLQCDDPSPFPELAAALFKAGSGEGAVRRSTASGATILVDVRWTVRCDADGNPVEIVEAGRRATEKRDTDGLARSEAKYRNLFNYMPIALWQLEAQELREMFDSLHASGVSDIRAHVAEHPERLEEALASIAVTEVNARAMKLFGAKDRETLLARMPSLWPDKNTYLEAGLARLSGELYYSAETTIETIDGRRIDVLFSCAFTDRNNPESSNLIGAIDISDRLRAERKLQQVQADFAHAARVATLGELTTSIAHEINQPLAAITASGETSLRWLARPGPDLDEVKTLTAGIVADAGRAADVISRVRAMADRHLFEHEPLSVNSIVEEALHFLRRELQTQEVKVILSLTSRLPSVLADRTQLQQVLVNLIINAIHAMAPQAPQQRRLTVSTSAPRGGGVRVEVEDAGPGIPDADLERLFDSFFTTKQRGLGIGLSICRSIIESHGGQIGCENLPVGARFSLTLPAVAELQPIIEAGHTNV